MAKTIFNKYSQVTVGGGAKANSLGKLLGMVADAYGVYCNIDCEKGNGEYVHITTGWGFFSIRISELPSRLISNHYNVTINLQDEYEPQRAKAITEATDFLKQCVGV